MKQIPLPFFLIVFAITCLSMATSKRINKNQMPQPDGFMYIPSGTDGQSAFWMSAKEVMNEEYHIFLKDLLDSGKTDLYKKAYPDTQAIKREFWVGNYGINYFTHPYFKQCPVVCITPSQIAIYCEWISKKYRLRYPEFGYPEFRLPTMNEWHYAARGNSYNNYFSWYGQYLRNSKGCFMANFLSVDDKLMYIDTLNPNQFKSIPIVYNYAEWSADALNETENLKTLHMAKKRKYVFSGMPQWSDSYFQNDFGLYNMSGNVAEIVMIRNQYRCIGGSYMTPGAYLRIDLLIDHHANDTLPQVDVGFRLVVNYITK